MFLLLAILSIHAYGDDILRITDDISLKQIANRVWIHTTAIPLPPWGNVSANGLAIITDNTLFLIDTAWNDNQTEKIVQWFSSNQTFSTVKTIVCHYHQDNLGGLHWINSQGYDSYAIQKTVDICKNKQLPLPKHAISSPYTFKSTQTPITVFFPGEGHTIDAVCVYLPEQKILFGGCSVKSLSSKNLGNIADANLDAWPESLINMKRTFPLAEIIIPGHGKEGNMALIDHTLSLLNQYRSSHE